MGKRPEVGHGAGTRREQVDTVAGISSLVVLAVVTVQALSTGWARWGSLYIDTGRELEWPRRIASGERLYADLYYIYGPLAPYVNALWFRLFGVRLEVLAIAGAATGILAALTTYLLARRFIGRLGSASVAVSFVCLCAFALADGYGIFNWVLPHAFAATYGMLFALLSLLFLVAHEQTGSIPSLCLSVAALALSALAKAEALVPAVAAHLVYLVGTIAMGRSIGRPLLAYALAGGAVGAVYGAFYAVTGPALLHDHLAGVVNGGSCTFMRTGAGLDDVGRSARVMGLSALLVLAVAAVGSAVAWAVRSPRASPVARVSLIVAACAAIAIGNLVVPLRVDLVWRCAPIVIALVLLVDGMRWFRGPEKREALLPFLTLWTFALASLPRIILSTSSGGYGYYLLPGVIVSFGVLLFRIAPEVSGPSGWSRAAWAAMGATLLWTNALAVLALSGANASVRSARVGTARGTLWVTPEDAAVVAPVLDFLGKTPADSCVLVLPDASSLNFLAARRGCDGMPSYLALDLHGGFDEEATLARWREARPGVIVWFDRNMEEFGNARFGVTYGQAAARWIGSNYVRVSDPRRVPAILVPKAIQPIP